MIGNRSGVCMNKDTATDVEKYAVKISDVIFDDMSYEIEVLFYLTQYCNLSCPGCYMTSSPCMPRNILPSSDLKFYLTEMKKMPGFANSVVFSGGEIFTLPIAYLECNAHQVLDNGLQLQMKTNGKWVEEPRLREGVMAMLRRLQPQRGFKESDALDFLSRMPRWLIKLLGKDVIKFWMKKCVPTTSKLDMAVSVDDKLHPDKSAQWLIDIASLFAGDVRVHDKVNLKTFTIHDSVSFFDKNILANPDACISDFTKGAGSRVVKYTLNAQPVESYFGNFVDVKRVSMVDKLSSIVLPPIGNASGRLVYSFWPDGTVGLDCDYLETVGRVPYRKKNGQMKSMSTLRREIYSKLVIDYKKAISK